MYKVAKVFAALLALLLIIATLLVLAGNYRPALATLADAETDTWYRLELEQALIASDGSEAYALVRRGVTDNLLVFFDGGGACWDANSCRQPWSISSILAVLLGFKEIHELGYYVDRQIELPHPLALGRFSTEGGLAPDRKDNPFADWTVVRIPYATGDMHMGTRTHTYTDGKDDAVTIHHHGAHNARKVLAWVYEQVPEPTKVVIAGSSAGGWGASYWARDIAQHYQQRPAYLVADAAGVAGEQFYDAMKSSWGAELEGHITKPGGDQLLEDLLLSYVQFPLPNLTILQSGTSRDGALTMYFALLNGFDPSSPEVYAAEWEKQQVAMLQRIAEGQPSYQLFYTDARAPGAEVTAHTLFETPGFYSASQDDITYVEWVRSNVIEGQPLSAGRGLVGADQAGGGF
ncbi:MAG: pectin acetylesterase-family hydrolase [Pseudomonadota bacterium]